jgi:hypothetical protein
MPQREYDATSLERQNCAGRQQREHGSAHSLTDESGHADQIVEIIE